MTYYVYKCNLNPQYGPDTGDWMRWVFDRTSTGKWTYASGIGWGRYSHHPELAKLVPGDLVIALQTGSRKTLVGVAEYMGDMGQGAHRRAKLRPRELINTKIPPLKQADPKGIGRIDALQGGKVQTLYDITTADAKALLAAGRLAKKQETLATVRNAVARAPSLTDKVAAVGAGFGDSETNRKVERAAVEAVTRKFEEEGWNVQSVEQEKLGYDLVCTRSRTKRHIEVKGIQGSKVAFLITAAEVRQWRGNPLCQIAVVTSALRKPSVTMFTKKDLLSFTLEEVLFRARFK